MEKAKKNQNVVSDVEVKEEVEMMNEEVKENVVVANEEEKEMMNEEAKVETVRRFCVECGKEIWIPKNSRQTQCNECKQRKAQLNAKRAKELAAERKAKLGMVTMNISLYESTKNILKAKSKEKGMSIADFLKELLEEPAKQENEIA